MKKFRAESGDFTLVLEPGEEVLQSLHRAAAEEGVVGAGVIGIGAIENPEIGYFDLPGKRYIKRLFEGEYEMLSLTGNIARKEGAPFAHLHAVLGGPDFGVFGGHLFSATVSVTLELRVNVGGRLERKPDERSGLWLLK